MSEKWLTTGPIKTTGCKHEEIKVEYRFWEGKPIEDLTKEELIEALERMVIWTREMRCEYMDLIKADIEHKPTKSEKMSWEEMKAVLRKYEDSQ